VTLTALTDPENIGWVPVDEGLTDDEAYGLLTAMPSSEAAPPPLVAAPDTALVAAAEVHTGAMIALVPSEADLERLAVLDGEPADQLHLTLAYLGEAAAIDGARREDIMAAAVRYFTDVVRTEAFSVNVFNPHDAAMDTALVLGIRGEDIAGAHQNMMSAVRGVYGGMPDNHKPWIPHVTLAYTDDVSRVEEFCDRLGPITFDTLRFAFGGEITDIPLNDPEVDVDTDGDYSAAFITTASGMITFDISRLPPRLRRYWLGPEGSARVGGWGNEGSFTKCTREMRKEGVPARMVNGLCANLYHEATGHTPNQQKGKGEHTLTATAALTISENLEAEGEVVADATTSPYVTWEGVLVIEGMESGDGRMFNVGSLDWVLSPPPKLMYQPANSGGHKDSVLVGQINEVWRDGTKIWGRGIIDLDATYNGYNIGREVYRLMSEEYLNGVSVDVDKVNNADVQLKYAVDAMPGDPPRMTVFNRGRIRGATLVAFPAFVEASIHLTGEVMTASALDELYGIVTAATAHQDEDEQDCGCALVATARTSGWSGMPVNVERTWDKNAAVRALVAWAGDDISGKYARAFLYKDADGDADLQGSYKFPIAEPIDGKLTIIADAVRNAAARLSNADIPAEDKTTIRSTIDSIMNRVHEKTGVESALVAASHTITIPDVPPAWWFNEPTDVDMKGALTITDEGRVYGRLAPKGVTHRSVKRQVPRNVDYSRFMGAETLVAAADGSIGRVVSGPITFNCGHAATDPQVYGTLENRIKHYDNSCSVFADIRIGEDKDGHVWVAGAVKPYASGEQIQQAMSCRLSGDWQPHPDKPGVSEFVAALLVPVPGFAAARTEASVTLEDGALVASSIPVEFAESVPDEDALMIAALNKRSLFAYKMTKELQLKKFQLSQGLEREG